MAIEPEYDVSGTPKRLYKYRSLRSSDELARAIAVMNGSIWAGRRSSFNDPYDCAPVITANFTSQEARAMIERGRGGNRKDRRTMQSSLSRSETNRKVKQEAVKIANNIIDRYGVVALTTRPDHLLMWGHYASEHTGVCIQLETLRAGSPFSDCLRVRYNDTRPKIEVPIPESAKSTIVQDVLLTKATCWSYEDEWRYIRLRGDGLIAFPPACVSVVILGSRCSGKHERSIREAVGHRVEIRRAELNAATYDIDIVPAD